MQLPTRQITFPRRPLVMGIVNINDDSFSGDGSLDPEQTLERVRRQVSEGADIIDVGAESARTNRGVIPVEEEIRRFKLFFEAWPEVVQSLGPRDEEQVFPPIISANTWRPEVAAACLQMGAEILNDMGGLHEPDNARLCARHAATLLIMHNPGELKVAATDREYEDILDELRDFFRERIDRARAEGLTEEQIILDPGIDFAKQRQDNLKLIAGLSELTREFRHPWLLPVSRKTVIGEVLQMDDPRERDPGTVALITAGMAGGGAIFRVHKVLAAWSAIKTLHAVRPTLP